MRKHSLLLILAVTLALVVLLTGLFGCGPETVTFPDENLEAAIRDALGKPVGEEITAAELANLTSLSVNSKAITDLTGLENFVNLKELTLSNNNISDISPLAGLTDLKWLDLSSNNSHDISPLAGLTNLEVLYLRDNNISDISPLVGNIGLSARDTVNLRGNPLSAISANVYIPQLEAEGVTVVY